MLQPMFKSVFWSLLILWGMGGAFLPALAEPAVKGEQRTSTTAPTLVKPWVVLVKADWCAVCKETEPLLSDLKKQFQNRTLWVELDVSNRKKIAEATARVKVLGLDDFFRSYGNKTGVVALIEPKSKKVMRLLIAETRREVYLSALNQALASAQP